RSLNDPIGTAEILHLMGSSLTIQDNEKAAAKALLVLASVYYRQNENDRGASTISEACDAAQRIGWEHKVYFALLYSSSSKYCQHFITKRGEGSAEKDPDRTTQQRVEKTRSRLSYLGIVLESQERLDEAAEVFDEACSMYHSISIVDFEPTRSVSHLTEVERKQSKKEEWFSWLIESLPTIAHSGSFLYIRESGRKRRGLRPAQTIRQGGTACQNGSNPWSGGSVL
ncbi:hypothetical protein FRC00_009016, partial [Tulasnella sp. 408]